MATQQTNRPTWLIIAAIAAVIWWTNRDSGTENKPVTPPAGGPDLVSVFQQADNMSQASQDAADMGKLCNAIARQIEYDGTRPQPRLTTGQQMDDLRRWAREYFTNGQSLGVQYPRLPGLVKSFLATQLGTSGGPINAEQRAKWASAFRTLGESALYASTQL